MHASTLYCPDRVRPALIDWTDSRDAAEKSEEGATSFILAPAHVSDGVAVVPGVALAVTF